MSRSRVSSICWLVALGVGACADAPPTASRAPVLNSAREGAPAQGRPIEAIVELRGDIPQVHSRVSVEDLPADLSDAELIQQVRSAGGLAFVGFKPAAAVRTKASGVFPAMTRSAALSARARVLSRAGIKLVRSFATDATIVVEMAPEEAPLLRSLSEVNFVEPVRELRLASADSIPWGVQKIGAPAVWTSYGNTGASASVSFLDSGMDQQHFGGDLPATLHCFYDALRFTGSYANCWDQDGHGSHVMGITSAQINSAGFIGVAPSSLNFASFKVCADPSVGGCYEDAIVSALLWIEANANWPRHVINMSLGGPSISSAYANVVSRLYSNEGALIVASTGNWPNPWTHLTVQYPAGLGSVIGVTGTLQNDQHPWNYNCAGYNIGALANSTTELAAPFVATSTDLGGTYSLRCGTSMAAAHVTGAAMLVWSQYPTWQNFQVRGRLSLTAVDIGEDWGRVNAFAAAAPPLPPQHTATIYGPFAIKPSAQCTWTFGTTVESPSIEWSVNGVVVGTGETLYYSSSAPFVLQLSLWNPSNGTGAGDTHSVDVSSENPECYDQ